MNNTVENTEYKKLLEAIKGKVYKWRKLVFSKEIWI